MSNLTRITKCGMAVFCTLAVMFSVRAETITIPHGLHSDGVVCDFVIRLAFPVRCYPMTLNESKSKMVLFGRYWVTGELIRTEIYWAEPLWGEHVFPEYPPGFIIIGTKTNLILAHAERKQVYAFNLTRGQRPAVNTVDGSYNIANLEYAWSDYTEMKRHQNSDEQSLYHVIVAGGRVDKIVGNNAQGGWTNAYSFETNKNTILLRKQYFIQPEVSIPASGLFDELKIDGRTNPGSYTVRYPLQGRECEVDWMMDELPNGKVLIPHNITVNVLNPPALLKLNEERLSQRAYDGDGKLTAVRNIVTHSRYNEYSDLEGRPLRICKITKVMPIAQEDANLLGGANAIYCSLTPTEREWRDKIEYKYWHADIDTNSSDGRDLDRFIKIIRRELAAKTQSWERLRMLNEIIVSDLMLNDSYAFSKDLKLYLTILEASDLSEMQGSCLSSLANLCRDWRRDLFVSTIESERIALQSNSKDK